MIETFTALIAAHLLSDFVLQWDRMVANKKKPKVLLGHVAIVGLSAAAAIGPRNCTAVLAVAAIVITHLLIDAWKVRAKDTLLTFTVDQVAHIVVMIIIALALPTLANDGLWSLMPGDYQALYYQALVYLAGFIAAVPMGGIIIRKLIGPLAPKDGAAENPKSPANTGRFIGWLERALTFGFMVVGEPEGVGFLLAAKSVLRIGDLKDPADRTHAEYIIIGTFSSFGWGILIAFVTTVAARHWQAV